MSHIKALSVASEVAPLIKTGGLADVAGALPLALAAEGVDVRTLLPGYPKVMGALHGAKSVHAFDTLFGGPARLLAARAGALDLLVLDAPHLYAREGGPYASADGVDYPDNAQRFAALAQVAAQIAQGLSPEHHPDILHAHDWQAALAPAYLHYSRRPHPPTVLTIHNLAFQGRYDKSLLAELGLPPESFTIEGVEYHDGVGFLKAGLQFADRITTVSPSYAAEIMTPEFGMGLDGLLHARAQNVSGVLNGVDETEWSPATDARIARRYDPKRLQLRTENRASLQARLGLRADPEALLIGVVSRLSWQKGLDLLLEALPQLVGDGVQLALLGAGDKPLKAGFAQAAQRYAGRVGVRIGYDEELAHLVQAGADVFLIPSRFEPCGLTQLYALRYGAVPVVARVGGLRDTIIDANEMALAAGVATGLQFSPVTAEALLAALRRAQALFNDKAQWRRLQLNGMKTDVSWRRPAQRYGALYRELIAARAP
jgi:starch synthase